MSNYKLDIFEVLTNVNGNEFDYYHSLSEEQKKALTPFLTMKWMLGTPNEKHIRRLNDRANKYMFSLSKHKELLYHLLCTVTMGKNIRYKYIKTSAGQSKGSKPVSVEVIQEYYQYSAKHALDVLPIFNADEIMDLAIYLGRQPDEIAKIKNEHKVAKAKTTKASKA